jgi:hypothetical protein
MYFQFVVDMRHHPTPTIESAHDLFVFAVTITNIDATNVYCSLLEKQ